jgi:hydroxypyruvate isomerase
MLWNETVELVVCRRMQKDVCRLARAQILFVPLAGKVWEKTAAADRGSACIPARSREIRDGCMQVQKRTTPHQRIDPIDDY